MMCYKIEEILTIACHKRIKKCVSTINKIDGLVRLLDIAC